MPASQQPFQADDALAWRRRLLISRAMLVLSLAMLAATFFLISPDPNRTYPGNRPWGTLSILKEIMQVMSLGGLAQSVRGTEIKDFAFHIAAATALLLLAARAVVSGNWPVRTREGRGVWFFGQALLTAWVGLSAASAWWSGDAELSLCQAALYAFMIAWAIGLSWTIERRDIELLLIGLLLISAAGAVLCVWYYYVRNPDHRPGFPIGNPTTLSASIIPAMLLAIVFIAERVHRWLPTAGAEDESIGRASLRWPAVAAATALIPLVWCFVLTYSRAAIIALIVGAGVLLLVHVGRRTRWIIGSAAIAAVLLVGGWALQAARLDAVMARGATVRFRLYMWQYAADMWAQRPISGLGAAAFPRHSGLMAIRDQALDPAAFMGDWAAHAHNELFEVFAEIGMLGGVTFVGGFVATIIAASRLLRSGLSNRQRWLYSGVFAAVVAMMTDLLFSVGLHLPGVPAVFFTLVGIVWAASRCNAGESLAHAGQPDESSASRRHRRLLVAAGAAACSIGGFWLAIRDWQGVGHEFAADAALAEQRPREAVEAAIAAQSRLLDPVRRVRAAEREVRARIRLARVAFRQYIELKDGNTASQPTPANAATEAARMRAIGECREAAAAATRLDRRVPTLRGMPAVGAQAAEMLAELHRTRDASSYAQWRELAKRAWRLQRVYRPFDEEALLALTRYPATQAVLIGLLRDALRSEAAGGEWDAALRRVAATPGFDDTLLRFVVAVGPIDPQTDLEPLIASMAPEVHRLAAARWAMRGDFLKAALHSAEATRLYDPMRIRFPLLYPMSLGEQAQYVFRASPTEPDGAIDLISAAIEALPRIQKQQLAAKERPFRERLAIYLLAAGNEQAAREQLDELLDDPADIPGIMADAYVNHLATTFLDRPPASRPPIGRWLDAALRLSPRHFGAWSWKAWLAGEAGEVEAINQTLFDAGAAGVAPDALRTIRRDLCQQYRGLCDQIRLPGKP